MGGKRGDRTTRVGSGLAAVLATRHASLRAHLGPADRGTVDGVHRARVATRRLREAVPVVAAGLQGVGRRRLLRGLRTLTRALGAVRECDVSLALLHAVDTSTSPALPDIVRRGVRDLRARRRVARKAFRQARERRRIRNLDVRLERLIAARQATSDTAWRDLLAQQLDDRARQLRSRLDGAGVLYQIEALHEVRIAGKRLRYVLELVGDARLVPVASLLRDLTRVQDVLGRLHDLDVLATDLRLGAAKASEPHGHTPLDAVESAFERERRSLHATYLRRRPALMRLADTVRDAVAPRVRDLAPA